MNHKYKDLDWFFNTPIEINGKTTTRAKLLNISEIERLAGVPKNRLSMSLRRVNRLSPDSYAHLILPVMVELGITRMLSKQDEIDLLEMYTDQFVTTSRMTDEEKVWTEAANSINPEAFEK